ncbi:exo-beta-N-acetylmuramidase NamZ family protein [Phocaeicola coprocola]|uniref:exo-beta-N-acetylmuramidase NamZ family protein n=1 Tax=Phocaeicola coprocola TaxID=310298 RepID=UPI003FD7A8F6
MKYITLFICWLAVLQATAQVKNGADRLEELFPLLENKRISLVVNQTSLVQNVHLLDTLYNKGVHITQVFAPEHGFRGDADAGEFIKNGKDYRTQVPIISLYGKNKKPQPPQLQHTDIVIFDIQDVGARFYTYISTMFYVMQACAENNKELIILDRPNPCDYVDGPVLDMKYKSFVGMLPIPVLHGCTIGELAQMINGEGWLGNNLQCPLKVITIEDWKHGQPYSLPVKPSPNLPNDQAIALYPSLCPFEGTSVSVGRGTDFPFQIIGSPTTKNLKFRFMPHPMKGSDKHPLHQDTYCYGLNLSSEKNIPKGFSLQYVIQFYNYFQNLTKHAEKEFFTRPHWFDLLMGTNQVRLDILKDKSEEQIRSAWQKKLNQYKEIRKS